MPQHTDRGYEQQLSQLRASVLEMGGLVEDLIAELKREYTIVIVTHNMQQAARISDRTAFFTVRVNEDMGWRTGVLVEYDETAKIFTNPADDRTEAYITGRFG